MLGARADRRRAGLVWHSLFRQYVPGPEWEALEAAYRDGLTAGAGDAPVVWLSMEPEPDYNQGCSSRPPARRPASPSWRSRAAETTGRPSSGTEPMILRSAGDEDVPAVLELWSLARSEHAVTRPGRGRRAAVREMPGSLLVAEDGRRLVGALIAAWDGWRGNMYRLAVHPDYRRHGIALSLVEEGERRLRLKGARRVTALVAREDDVAGALWVAAGYAYDDVIGRFVGTYRRGLIGPLWLAIGSVNGAGKEGG